MLPLSGVATCDRSTSHLQNRTLRWTGQEWTTCCQKTAWLNCPTPADDLLLVPGHAARWDKTQNLPAAFQCEESPAAKGYRNAESLVYIDVAIRYSYLSGLVASRRTYSSYHREETSGKERREEEKRGENTRGEDTLGERRGEERRGRRRTQEEKRGEERTREEWRGEDTRGHKKRGEERSDKKTHQTFLIWTQAKHCTSTARKFDC